MPHCGAPVAAAAPGASPAGGGPLVFVRGGVVCDGVGAVFDLVRPSDCRLYDGAAGLFGVSQMEKAVSPTGGKAVCVCISSTIKKPVSQWLTGFFVCLNEKGIV